MQETEVEGTLKPSKMLYPSDPPYNIDNRPLFWLYTHCVALGMKAESDQKNAESDIALFVSNLEARVRELEATQAPRKLADDLRTA